MIDYYFVPTANGQKIAIMLEEAGIQYTPHLVERKPGDSPEEKYLLISPLGKYPAIVDQDGPKGCRVTLFETLAITFYLTEKAPSLMPVDPSARFSAHAWAAVASTNLTPMMATQYFLTLRAKSDVSEATKWVEGEAFRCLEAIDRRLEAAQYLAGDDFSYADVLTYPLIVTSARRLGPGLESYSCISRWVELLSERPAFRRGMEVSSNR